MHSTGMRVLRDSPFYINLNIVVLLVVQVSEKNSVGVQAASYAMHRRRAKGACLILFTSSIADKNVLCRRILKTSLCSTFLT